MAAALSTILTQRWGEDWLIGAESQRFWQVVEQRSQQLAQLPQALPRVFIAEPDPVLFLAGLMAAGRHQSVIFLGNPHWQNREWSQVKQHLSADLVWGSTSLSLPSKSAAFCQTATLGIPTGGSSGQIKWAMHTWETLLAAVEGFQQHFQTVAVNAYCTLPLYHVSGLMQALRTFFSGGRLVLQSFKQLEQASLEVPAHCFISLVPTQLQRLLTAEARWSVWLSQFKAVLLGGAPAWPQLLTQADQQQLPLALTYGMTETAAQIATLLPSEFLAGNRSSGRVLPHVQVEILDEAGDRLPTGKIGHIAIRSRSLCQGYYAADNANCANWSDNPTRLFQPDDLGFLDAEGYLSVVGRNSHKIITGGEKVFPEEVEAAIWQTGLVQDVGVVGLSDRLWGQVVTAIYVPKQTDLSSQMIKAAIAPQLAAYKLPKQWLAVAALPRNLQGKVNRQALRTLAIGQIP